MDMRSVQGWTPKFSAAAAALALVCVTGCGNNNGPVLSSSTVALTASATTVNVGGTVTLTATLSPGSTNPAPIGAIDFYNGSAFLAPVLINNGLTVTTSTTFTTPGSQVLTASYYGDTSHASSTSPAVTVSVYDPTTITVTGAPTVQLSGSPVTLTATLKGGSFNPTGTVTFFSGGTAVGTATAVTTTTGTVITDTATLTTSTLPIGNDSITASLGANGYFLGSTSAATTVQVHGALVPTTSSVTATPSGSISSGTVETLTATLTPTGAPPAPPTGTFTFFDGTTNLGTATVSGNMATLATKQFVTGVNSITAVYSGDLFFGASTSPGASLTVTPYVGATYTNPLSLTDPTTGKVYNCPDPAIIKTQVGVVDTWYAYCTGDAFNSADMVGGAFRAHLISIFSSSNLTTWTYVRDALATLPPWVAAGQELQTPAIKYINGMYTLYYEAPSVAAAPNGSAIGVATAATAAGPFLDSGTPVIPQSTACGGGCNRTTFSPEVIADASGQLWITYGGVFAGLSVRKLSASGLTSVASSEINIAVDNYYQNPFLWFHNGYFYEFVTAGACCSGPTSTYNVHVGRSASITGPYLDAEGNDLNAYSTPSSVGAPGGDPVLVMNGNDIVGSGSNSIFTDETGQDYILYSGVSKRQPYLPAATGYTARQLMMDAIDWNNGWPRARNGAGPSDFTTPQPVPAAQPGATNGYVSPTVTPDSPGSAISASSDEFNATSLSSQWTFLHATPTYSLTGSAYAVQSANAESTIASSMATLPILAEPEPAGNYLLEVKVSSTVPPSGYVFNYTQAGVFIYSTDTSYLRLDEVPVYETRQVEFLNQIVPPAGSGFNAVNFAPVGTPNFGNSTYLRIAKRVGTGGAPDTYTSYSSTDGVTYLKGPAWTASYGATAKIGLFAGNTSGYTASFDYIRVTTLLP